MPISAQLLFRELKQRFPFEPTIGQAQALGLMADFVADERKSVTFLLKGYAGTGKTTLIRSLVESLESVEYKAVLLAPTGRAAKVMAQYSGVPAYTIHKAIYIPKSGPGGAMHFTLRPTKATNTIFVVDEASMISDTALDAGMAGSSLMEDLFRFVDFGKGNKLMLIGDTAQLPPVHFDRSPALDVRNLESYNRICYTCELTEVMRQAAESGVLRNATQLRHLQATPSEHPSIELSEDVIRLTDGYEIEEALNNANNDGVEHVVVVVRSNKRANLYNRQIRSRVHWREDRLATGDYLMIVRNNYFWLPSKSKAGFLANGDIVEVLEMRNEIELHGLSFVDVTLRLPDLPDEPPFESKLMLDVLDIDGPSLDRESSQRLYESVMEDYMDIPQKGKRMEAVKNDPFLNALQVKFAYAVTGHKAQGGQWKHVFIEQPWLPEGEVDLEYQRWLYTAFTRSYDKVYLLGFPDAYFDSNPS